MRTTLKEPCPGVCRLMLRLRRLDDGDGGVSSSFPADESVGIESACDPVGVSNVQSYSPSVAMRSRTGAPTPTLTPMMTFLLIPCRPSSISSTIVLSG